MALGVLVACGALVVVGVSIVPLLLGGFSGGGTGTTTCAITTGEHGDGVKGVPSQWQGPVKDAAGVAGMPVEVIAAQIGAESGWDPRARSRAGAQGLAQFMPATWAQFGEGDPFDGQASITAMGVYMKHLMGLAAPHAEDPEHRMELALAAYNAGPGTMEALGWDWTKAPAETTNYVSAILDGGQSEYSWDCAAFQDLEQLENLGEGQWAPPLPGATLTSGYGSRALGSGPSWANQHVGIDLATDRTLRRTGPGGKVVAVDEMVVTRASCTTDTTMGCNVVGRLKKSRVVVGYYHLDSVTVKNGQTAKRGDVLGVEGNKGGWSFPTHLHFEVYDEDSPDDAVPYGGHNVDPVPVLRKMGAL